MSSLSRVCIAAGVAIVNGHHGCKLKSLVKSFRQNKKAFTSSNGADVAGLRPFSGFMQGYNVHGGERKMQSDDSFRQVMYLSCWGPS